MEINKELIERVAKNAKLNLSEKEIREFLPQFEELLKVFSELKQINTDNVKPSFQPIEVKNKVREDIQKDCIPVKELLKNTKHKKDNYFVGPKAL